MKTMEAIRLITSRAEEIRTDGPQRFPEAASVGDCVRQGDIYITKLEVVEGKRAKVQPQLAPGTTKGSRHILSHTCLHGIDDSAAVESRVDYFVRDVDALTGPVIRVKEEVIVTHPEHGDWILGKGIYGITYQRAFADELKRVLD
jgi:hypothetical protein